jgi:hypothetical protein
MKVERVTRRIMTDRKHNQNGNHDQQQHYRRYNHYSQVKRKATGFIRLIVDVDWSGW